MKDINWSDRIIDFMTGFRVPGKLPTSVTVLEPWQSREVVAVASLFYQKFYSDIKQRTLILGINPGRFGGGQTGIPFTDPVRLLADCGITSPFKPRTELSSDFIYRMIQAFGGPEVFYRKFYITSVCPVGFTYKGKNLNYYDLPTLQSRIEKWAPEWMNSQIDFGLNREVCFCIGEGKNYHFLTNLNQQYNWFKSIIGLPHPRFIMQYRRKQLDHHIRQYIDSFHSV